QQPLAKQTAAHPSAGLIQNANQRGVVALDGEQRLQQFEVAHGGCVEHPGLAAVVPGGAIEMIECGFLRVAQIMQDGPSGGDGQRLVVKSAAIERQQMEMIAQKALAVIEAEDPVVEGGAESG